MTTTAPTSPEVLRPWLQSKIGQMPDEELQFVHRVLLKVEAQRLWEQLKAEGAGDRQAGRYERLNDIIAEVRAERAEARG